MTKLIRVSDEVHHQLMLKKGQLELSSLGETIMYCLKAPDQRRMIKESVREALDEKRNG